MGAHLIDGEFQSDKYPTTPRGKVPLSVKDVTAQDLLWAYAKRRRAVDSEFSDDLEAALLAAGFNPERGHFDKVAAKEFSALVLRYEAPVGRALKSCVTRTREHLWHWVTCVIWQAITVAGVVRQAESAAYLNHPANGRNLSLFTIRGILQFAPLADDLRAELAAIVRSREPSPLPGEAGGPTVVRGGN